MQRVGKLELTNPSEREIGEATGFATLVEQPLPPIAAA